MIILFCAACAYDVLDTGVDDASLLQTIRDAAPTNDIGYFILADGQDLSQIPQEPQNPLSHVKIALGQYLFFETGIGTNPVKEESMATYSCSSCHVPKAGFRPGASQGIGEGGNGFGDYGEARYMNDSYTEEESDIQGIRPLTVLNVAYVTNTFWSGQFGAGNLNEGTEDVWKEENKTSVNHLGLSGIESQNIEGLELHRMFVDKEILDSLGYTNMYDLAFPDIPESERYNNKTTSFAISAYLRSLITNQAPFQHYLKGNINALSESQKRGAQLFFGKANCSNCHHGPTLNGYKFEALGVNDMFMRGGLNTSEDDPKNLGRGGFTGHEYDNYKFKIPQLYNLKHAPFYFHGSSKETLKEVIEYKNLAQKENPNVPEEQISGLFRPLYLTDAEKEDLYSFLADALYDPYTDRYVPSYLFSGNCFPNNDPESKEDLGCE